MTNALITLLWVIQLQISRKIFEIDHLLLQVITWATYHKDDPPPPEDDENKEKRTDDISSWDSDFLKVDQGTLFELILAANYLDIKVNFKINIRLGFLLAAVSTLLYCVKSHISI